MSYNVRFYPTPPISFLALNKAKLYTKYKAKLKWQTFCLNELSKTPLLLIYANQSIFEVCISELINLTEACGAVGHKGHIPLIKFE